MALDGTRNCGRTNPASPEITPFTRNLIIVIGGLDDDGLAEALRDLLGLGDPNGRWPWPGESFSYIRFASVFEAAQRLGEAGQPFVTRCPEALVRLVQEFDPNRDHPGLLFELVRLSLSLNRSDLLRTLASRTDCDRLKYRNQNACELLAAVREKVAQLPAVAGT